MFEENSAAINTSPVNENNKLLPVARKIDDSMCKLWNAEFWAEFE